MRPRKTQGARVKLRRIAYSVVLAWGWRRAASAFIAGALSVLALAPVNAWPVLFLTFPIIVLLLDGSGAGALGGIGSAAIAGWCFGFGYFLAGLYWVGFAFLVDVKTFGWLLPFGVIGLPALLALFTSLGFALAQAFWTRGPARLLTLAVALTASEWLRGHVLSGFPWNAFGYALTGPLTLAQGSALVGLWGLTFFAVYLFASPAVLADDPLDHGRVWLAPALALGLLAALAGYGAVRLALAPSAFVSGVRLRIMQPDLPQDDKFNYSAKQQVMSRYLALSERTGASGSAGLKDVTHLIWPESAFPFFLAHEPDALAQIAALLANRTVLITGGARIAETARDAHSLRAFNSIYVIDGDGSVLAVYDKVHLVPFGEYLPFQGLLESIGLMQLTKVQGGFVAGDRRRALAIKDAPPLLPLICYEIIFPDEAVPQTERPGWLLNVTNDGWFGNSSGPHQHFQQARVRAIEQGLPLVRAANTGISAVVDPFGRILEQLPLGAEGVIDSALPERIEPTLYLRGGDIFVKILFGLALVLVVRRRLRGP
jgi:apolipoprotein N-acyltransferase